MLVISSATKEAYIALKAKDKTAFSQIDANCKQSENILVKIDELLDENNIDISEVGNMAVVVGPGSFTGIRIGIALVKGLCAGKKDKVIAISSLDFMAKEVLKQNPNKAFVCAIDALSGLVYAKGFDKDGKTLFEEKLHSKEEFEKLDFDVFGLDEENLCEKKISLSSETLLALALEKEEKNEFEDVKTIAPIYLRLSQAEENLKKNKKTS